MLRSVLSAICLAGLLAAARPTVADPLATTVSAHVQAVAAIIEQPAPLPITQANAKHKTAPAGFGWG
jgi:hypothetical protein